MGAENRLAGLRALIAEQGAGALVSLDPSANAWIAGFHGSTSAVIVTASRAVLLVDFRYAEQAETQRAPGVEMVVVEGSLETRAGEWLDALDAGTALFEPDRMSVTRRDAVADAFSGELRPAPALVDGLRQRKDAGETASIRRACAIAEESLLEVVRGLRAGVTERETAALLEYEFKRRGARRPSFDTIVLFGARSSLPHGVPGGNPLKSGDLVLVDCGCEVDGYCSDLTRTWVYGRISAPWVEEIHRVTLEAQEAALAAVRAGVRAADVDAAARGVITRAGYGPRFGHGTGHGVGLEIHESPRLNPQSAAVLAAGMAVTIEPGIYLPGQGGVRIEDLVVVTEDGCDVLTTIPKQLQVLNE